MQVPHQVWLQPRVCMSLVKGSWTDLHLPHRDVTERHRITQHVNRPLDSTFPYWLRWPIYTSPLCMRLAHILRKHPYPCHQLHFTWFWQNESTGLLSGNKNKHLLKWSRPFLAIDWLGNVQLYATEVPHWPTPTRDSNYLALKFFWIDTVEAIPSFHVINDENLTSIESATLVP